MNLRQQNYKANRLAGMNQYNAARAAGYSHNYAAHRSNLLENVVTLKDEFERQGLTNKAIVKWALERMNSKNERIGFSYYRTILEAIGYLKSKADTTGTPGTRVNVFPNKTIVFTGIDDLDNNGIPSETLHTAKSTESNRIEI